MMTIAVVGIKKSGKTTTVEVLVKGLTKRGYRVGTMKHINEINFTIDTHGKDTYRHTKAGAHATIVVAPMELSYIKKLDTRKLSFQDLIDNCKEDVDFLICEGFGKLIGKDKNVPKIVAIKKPIHVIEARKSYWPIIAFTGKGVNGSKEFKIPTFLIPSESEKLIDLVLKAKPCL